jgi:hypothetical protein
LVNDKSSSFVPDFCWGSVNTPGRRGRELKQAVKVANPSEEYFDKLRCLFDIAAKRTISSGSTRKKEIIQ